MSIHVIGTWLGLQISKQDDKNVNANRVIRPSTTDRLVLNILFV